MTADWAPAAPLTPAQKQARYRARQRGETVPELKPGRRPAGQGTKRAMEFIEDHAHTDGAHHKQWVLNQVLLILSDGARRLDDEGTAP